MKKLRVCIDARIQNDGGPGGVQQFIMGLANGISKLESDKEEYFFLTYSGSDEWLRPYINEDESCKIISIPAPSSQKWKSALKPFVNALREYFPKSLGVKTISIPISDGTIEKLGIDVMHFTIQMGFITDIPSIYHPHDLQHIHLPQYFSQHAKLGRDTVFKAFIKQATIVAVGSSWVKNDLIENYKLPENKIAVVPLAPPAELYTKPSEEDLLRIRNKFVLPDNFILYPAQTFPHKNHVGLLESLAILKNRHDIIIPFISCGKVNEFGLFLKKKAQALGIENHVYFLDFVNPLELQCLYTLACCVVVPTEFEAGSFPIWEAFLSGVPVACSNVTSLPKQVDDAALIFNPNNYDEIAESILRLWNDENLRYTLLRKGKERVSQFTWEKTAKIFRAYYRKIGNKKLTEEDVFLLNMPPLL